MNALMIGDVLHAGGYRFDVPRRPRERKGGNGVPVWRNSYNEGQLEHRIWRPIAGGNKRKAARLLGTRLKVARTLERKTRTSRRVDHRGCKNGVLGPVGVEVLEYLYSVVDYATGQLEKAIQTIADNTGRSYGATHNALKALRQHGFIHWVRRCRPCGSKGEAGPQAVQIPSAYVLLSPTKLRPLIKHIMDDGPIPTDELWRREQRHEAKEAMLSALSAPEFLQAEWVGDDAMGETLMRIAQLLEQERESTKMRDTGGL